ncbi:hypothetical protein DVH24_005928 [Malus domestica]|uniref:Uncharacterized protein n=1 Tax=Malus domestica TaxID=3750 RepID=A0A498ING8_MALDO|nr:hypothetical protein DVH24_005928 [Malus domestica]
MFHLGKLSQNLGERDNGRQRMPLKHFVEHIESILEISDFHKLTLLGVSRFGRCRSPRVKQSQVIVEENNRRRLNKTRHHISEFESQSSGDASAAITNL